MRPVAFALFKSLISSVFSDLVLAAMKSAATSGSTPAFGSQDLEMDKLDITRPEYVAVFWVTLLLILSRRVKMKTEKALYADEVGAGSSVK